MTQLLWKRYWIKRGAEYTSEGSCPPGANVLFGENVNLSERVDLWLTVVVDGAWSSTSILRCEGGVTRWL